MYYYYSICLLRRNRIDHLNPHVQSFLDHVIALVESEFDAAAFIKKAHEFVEKNEYVFKCGDVKLYEHQKQIFTAFKNDTTPKLVLYIAPTGTGKTLTPIGLSEQYRVIFVCAARHVGLALAKACISAITARASMSGAPNSSSGRVVPRPSDRVAPSSITVPA